MLIHYLHKVFKFGWFRISIYKLQEKFTFRFEISSGWE